MSTAPDPAQDREFSGAMPHDRAGRSVVAFAPDAPFFGEGPGCTIGARGDVLVDVGVRTLTPDADYWHARVRQGTNRAWLVARFGGDSELMVDLFGVLWPKSQKWGFGPLAGSSLNGYTGSVRGGGFCLSPRLFRAHRQLKENTARLALEQRPVAGWCKRGHQITDDNKSGEHCRRCRNATYRAQRAGISIEAALARGDQRHAA